jgi:hypothetical protein
LTLKQFLLSLIALVQSIYMNHTWLQLLELATITLSEIISLQSLLKSYGLYFDVYKGYIGLI